MRSLGVNVILYGNDFDEAKLEAKSFSRKAKIRFVFKDCVLCGRNLTENQLRYGYVNCKYKVVNRCKKA